MIWVSESESLGDTKGYSGTCRAIVNICFDIVVDPEPEVVASELNTRTEANGSLLRVQDILTIYLIVR
jgi:hypothetical protein